jgi:hypothetical protein
MNKIPTIFKRDEADRSKVTEEWNPECLWVRDGEGTATQKYDGTCVAFAMDKWWARREVKPGKEEPPNFIFVSKDLITGKTMGWEPIEQSPFHKFLLEAINSDDMPWEMGTYELCGPKINGNPEGYDKHTLVKHEYAVDLDPRGGGIPRSYEEIKGHVAVLKRRGVEGIVYHHPDGRMAKIKGKDFA